ncbi:MAG: 50S ribosomal protein L32 [Syntrophomonadaceae bacterium]|nr:50S ribosomal protein L32 [Syntrophomonadaceae bacterium]
MGVPARRRSRTRVNRRRATQKSTAPGMVECPQCHELRLPHRMCLKCGHYRGREIQAQA